MVKNLLTNAIIDIWPMLTIFLVVIISIRLMYIHNGNEKFVFYKEFLNLLFIFLPVGGIMYVYGYAISDA